MNMRALWRLAIWGTSAATALTLVVVASLGETGSRRIATAMASPGGKDAQKAPVQLAARSPEQETEARRLMEAVRTLTADRDRLAARLSTVERNLEDVTGSIRRQAAAPVPLCPAPRRAAPVPAKPRSIAGRRGLPNSRSVHGRGRGHAAGGTLRSGPQAGTATDGQSNHRARQGRDGHRRRRRDQFRRTARLVENSAVLAPMPTSPRLGGKGPALCSPTIRWWRLN